MLDDQYGAAYVTSILSCFIHHWLFIYKPKPSIETKIKVSGQWVFNDSELIADAVLAGEGIAYIPEELIQDNLLQGQLIKVLDEYAIAYPGFHLYYPHRRQQSPALKLVIDTLRIN